MFSLKNKRFQLIVRFAHLDYDVRMKTLRRRRSKIKMAAVLQLKINNYILETRISLLHSDNRKNLTWVFIRMCSIVTLSDMTSFVYIGDCQNG